MKVALALIYSLFLALFLSACANSSFVKTAIQSNNEGIFLKTKKGESFSIIFHNPNEIQSTLDKDLALKLENLGLTQVMQNADYEILINLVDMKKHSYSQRITTSPRFWAFDPLEDNGEWLVENYYTMQVNIQISSKNAIQKTSLLARTAYLSDKKHCQLSLENKIINQISSFFYFKPNNF